MSSSMIPAASRSFLAALADVVFGNPYSAQRTELILRLVPDATPAALTLDREALARVTQARLAPLLGGGASALPQLCDDDRRLLEPGLLYIAYHRYVPQLDALIERQARQSGSPLPVAFAPDAIGDLVRFGFTEDRAVRYFALFFQLRRTFYFIHDLLPGECESMRRLREMLWNNVFTHNMRDYDAMLWNRMEDFSTLLLGETGTGKGSAAAVIGRSEFIPYRPAEGRFAANFADTFIATNLSQFPDTLIESELFGHRKGAFTGAIGHHKGVFERCNAHGALFLDEIGEVPVPVQIKLLQVLQDRTFTPLGGHERVRFSGRVIAATNQPLSRLLRDGRFREDFYYRLCSDVIEMPTLRQRIAESPRELARLVQSLVERIADTRDVSLSDAVLDVIQTGIPREYSWPGNVRELEQAVRQVLLTGRCRSTITEARKSNEELLLEKIRAGSLTAAELVSQYCALLHDRLGAYTEVAQRTGLDPRTARKHIESAREPAHG